LNISSDEEELDTKQLNKKRQVSPDISPSQSMSSTNETLNTSSDEEEEEQEQEIEAIGNQRQDYNGKIYYYVIWVSIFKSFSCPCSRTDRQIKLMQCIALH
jgi:hypothetical protein